MREFDKLEEIANQNKGEDVFVVLTENHTEQRPLSRLLISVLQKTQNAAGIGKNINYPCLVLVNQLDEVPRSKKRECVKLELNYLTGITTLTQKRINQVFEATETNAAPFKKINQNYIANEYGPILASISIDPANHEENHDAIKDSIENISESKSTLFSDFQNLVKAVINSKFCVKCLRAILEQFDSAKKVKRFLEFVLDGIVTPVDTDYSKKKFLWCDDSDRPYRTQFWKAKVVNLPEMPTWIRPTPPPLTPPTTPRRSGSHHDHYSKILEKLSSLAPDAQADYVSMFNRRELDAVFDLLSAFQSSSTGADCAREKVGYLKRTIREKIREKSSGCVQTPFWYKRAPKREVSNEENVDSPRVQKSRRSGELPPTSQEPPIKRSRSKKTKEENVDEEEIVVID